MLICSFTYWVFLSLTSPTKWNTLKVLPHSSYWCISHSCMSAWEKSELFAKLQFELSFYYSLYPEETNMHRKLWPHVMIQRNYECTFCYVYTVKGISWNRQFLVAWVSNVHCSMIIQYTCTVFIECVSSSLYGSHVFQALHSGVFTPYLWALYKVSTVSVFSASSVGKEEWKQHHSGTILFNVYSKDVLIISRLFPDHTEWRIQVL